MIGGLIDHLWQSTLCALAAALLVLVFHNNGASIRFRIWLAASVKFLIPLPLLVLIGKQLLWQAASPAHPASGLSVLMNQLAEPGGVWMAGFATPATSPGAPTTHSHWSAWTIVLIVWAAGFAALSCRRLHQWLKLNSVAWSSSLLAIEAPLPVRETASTLEPGIFGILWPILLLPKGIATRLTPGQLNTIIAHELHHWRRRDNLTAAIHMVVETIFWFHPLVWWLGNRMIVERERAVDEAVIHSGSDREVYAESILKVCQFYVEPPLICTSGVSGGTLRKRIEEIMTYRTLLQLHFAKKCLLSAAAAAGVGGPIAIGLLTAPYAAALAQQPAAAGAVEMKHYESSEWKFSLDIPKRWNAFPPVSANSPNEVVRFESYESGIHNLTVFRLPHDPKQSPAALSAVIQDILAKRGFANFVTGETTIGFQKVVTLTFDGPRPDGTGTWSCIYYYYIDGTIAYTLGFGTTDRAAMFPVYEKMAKTFVSREPST